MKFGETQQDKYEDYQKHILDKRLKTKIKQKILNVPEEKSHIQRNNKNNCCFFHHKQQNPEDN